MPDKMEITTTPEKDESMKQWRARADLEYTVLNTRNKLRVVIRSLEDLGEAESFMRLPEIDTSILYGSIGILEEIADNCDRVYNGLIE